MTPAKTSHNGRVLTAALLSLSESDDWPDAVGEWRVADAYIVPDDRPMRRCVCGHSPIRNVFVLENRSTGERAEVGCVCVRRFLPDATPVDPFAVLDRVRKNPCAAVKPDEVGVLAELGWVAPKDVLFLRSTGRKPFARLSPAQRRWRLDANRRLLEMAQRTPDD